MLNKRWITLPVEYLRPFALKAVFWAILRDTEFAVFGTVNGELNFLQNPSKTAFEAKGRLCTTGKVIQRLLNVYLHTYLTIYRYRWRKWQIQYIYQEMIIGYTHAHCVGSLRKPLTEADFKNESVSLPAQMSRRGL